MSDQKNWADRYAGAYVIGLDGTKVSISSGTVTTGRLRRWVGPPCLVEFCRKCCPVLPEDATVNRADGRVICEPCGRELRDHPTFAYPSGLKHAVRCCEGRYWHL
jgi:hypothetical protein